MKHSTDCSIEKTAELLSDVWTMLIVRDLLLGSKRFCDLERSLEGISTRTLTLKLKALETQGIIKKLASGAYAPTPKGKALQSVQKAMEAYGKRYL